MKTIAIFSIKGGVGKTAIAVNTAYALAVLMTRRTLLWDLDAQGAASDILRVSAGRGARKLFARKSAGDLFSHIEPTAFERLDIIASDESMRRLDVQLAETDRSRQLARLLSGIADHYDRVVLDCPPGLGLLAEQIFRAADLVIEPITPSPLSARAHDALSAHLARHHKGRPPVMPVYSMVDRRRALHRNTVGLDLLAIPYASSIEQMAVRRQPLVAFGGKSAAARAFAELATLAERRLLSGAADKKRRD